MMIVPEYWAEGRIQKRVNDRQITVRRYGWSDVSLEEAQANADERTQEAFTRIAAGEKLQRRELKVAYNGAEGMPIREEIVGRHGDAVLTRNSYGALCLNTPNVFFADVDFVKKTPGCLTCQIYFGLFVGAVALGVVQHSVATGVLTVVAAMLGGRLISSLLHRKANQKYEDVEIHARQGVVQFISAHPAWHLRVYRTPAGLRLLAMHDVFDPSAPEVKAAFEELGTDPVYLRMCLNQHCFRARVSPKPWRVGIKRPMRPRPGVWPVSAEKLPLRQRWVEEYETKTPGFASCRFMEALGSLTVHPEAQAVQFVHDALCQAHTELPIA